MLDEADLLEFWQGGHQIAESLVWHVDSGGWLRDLEDQERLIGLSNEGVAEYLIATEDACVNVLSVGPPVHRSDGVAE